MGHELVFLTASQLAAKIRSGEVSSLEVVEAHLDQIASHNQTLNAIVTLDEAGARHRAKEADEALLKGEIWGPLHGVPVTIKDHYATAGLRTTSSFPLLADYVPKQDATIVARLRHAGAIILGKTNLPELGLDIQTNSPIFGVTNNPWDISRTPGGSTGGGAAAVAAGLSPLEIGSDLGGSIRIPAHFCGIFGLKPTEHLVPSTGLTPGLAERDFQAFRHMVSFGPLARSIEDLKLCLPIIAGPDNKDVKVPSISLNLPAEPDLKDLRLAWTDDFGGVPVTAETRATLQAFTERLAEMGCHVEPLNPPDLDFERVWQTYGEIMDMEVRVYIPSLLRLIVHLFGKRERSGVPMAQSVYPITYKKYIKALTRREKMIARLESFLSKWDAWLCPVTATAAFKHHPLARQVGPYLIYKEPIKVDGQAVNYWVANVSFTTVFNLTGNPVVVIPVSLTQEGLPIGIQVVGRRWADMKLLTIAERLAEATGWCQRPPGY